MEDQVIISRTKLEALEADSKAFRDELKEKLAEYDEKYSKECQRLREASGYYTKTYDPNMVIKVLSTNEILKNMNSRIEDLEKSREALIKEREYLYNKIANFNALPWYKRIFTKP